MPRKLTYSFGLILLVFGGFISYHYFGKEPGGVRGNGGSPPPSAAAASTQWPAAALERGESGSNSQPTHAEGNDSKPVLAAGHDGRRGLSAHPLSEFRNAIDDLPGGVDPMIVFARDEFSDEQIAAYDDLHVIAFNKAIGTLCETTVEESLPDRPELHSCNVTRERPPHPYRDLPTEELEALAVFDPAAALIKGERLTGADVERERLSWYLRAVALSEKSGPIMKLANRRYYATVANRWNEASGRIERQAPVLSVKTRLVLETIAHKMGDPRANVERWAAILLDMSPSEPVTVDAEVTELLLEMAAIQQSVTGSVQMRELIDA